MRRIATGPHEGWKVQSNRGRFYLGLGGHIYALHLEMGRLHITIEASKKSRAAARARHLAHMEQMRRKP